jgi:hypothetical protein
MRKYILYQNDNEKEIYIKHNIFNNIIYFKSHIYNNQQFNYNKPKYDNKYDLIYKNKLNQNQCNHQYSIKLILEECINNNYNEIMILEYDIYFHKKFHKLYLEYNILIKNNSIIHLGSSQHQWNNIKIKKYKNITFYKNSHSLGTFAIILKKEMFNDYLNFINYNLSKINVFPTDVILSIISNNYKSIVIYPNLIICDISKSTISIARDIKTLIQFKWNMNNYNII